MGRSSLAYRSRTGQRPMKLEGSRESLCRGEGPRDVAEIRPFAAEAALKLDVSCLRPAGHSMASSSMPSASLRHASSISTAIATACRPRSLTQAAIPTTTVTVAAEENAGATAVAVESGEAAPRKPRRDESRRRESPRRIGFPRKQKRREGSSAQREESVTFSHPYLGRRRYTALLRTQLEGILAVNARYRNKLRTHPNDGSRQMTDRESQLQAALRT
jgi:hypothetical protein